MAVKIIGGVNQWMEDMCLSLTLTNSVNLKNKQARMSSSDMRERKDSSINEVLNACYFVLKDKFISFPFH